MEKERAKDTKKIKRMDKELRKQKYLGSSMRRLINEQGTLRKEVDKMKLADIAKDGKVWYTLK